jgi:hypothetical protein
MSSIRSVAIVCALLAGAALLAGCGSSDNVRVYGSVGVGYYSGYSDPYYRGPCCYYGGVRPPPPPQRPPPGNRPPPDRPVTLPARPARPPSTPTRPRPRPARR